MTQPIPPKEATPEPAIIAAAATSVLNAILGVLLVLGVHMPAGLPSSLGVLLIAIVSAAGIVYPYVAGWLVRSKVTPVK